MKKIEITVFPSYLDALMERIEGFEVEEIIVTDVFEKSGLMMQAPSSRLLAGKRVEVYAEDHIIADICSIINLPEFMGKTSDSIQMSVDLYPITKGGDTETGTKPVEKAGEVSQSFKWTADFSRDGKLRTIQVIYRRSDEVMAKIAGVLTLGGFDIQSARTYRHQKETFYIFNVVPVIDSALNESALDEVKTKFQGVLAGDIDLGAEMKVFSGALNPAGSIGDQGELRTKKRQDHRSPFTVFEVSCPGYRGGLYYIVQTIIQSDIDIWFSKASVKNDKFEGVFHLKDRRDDKGKMMGKISEIELVIRQMLNLR